MASTQAVHEQLRAQIQSAQQELEAEQQKLEHDSRDIEEALERQRLRRQLEYVQRQIASVKEAHADNMHYRSDIDNDEDGENLRSSLLEPETPHPNTLRALGHLNSGEITHCSQSVIKAEYTWKICGMSWMKNALQAGGHSFARAPADEDFQVGSDSFEFVYNPLGGRITVGCRGTLAIVHRGNNENLTFRYKIFIQRQGEEFIQWGEQGDECYSKTDTQFWAFGPDVQKEGIRTSAARGIFGLSYEELLHSDYVIEDTLVVRFELEVKQHQSYLPSSPLRSPKFELPPGTLSANLLSLLDTGKCSDVTFIVQGQRIQAHAPILCSRSEVFDRELNSGMQECVLREIVVDDCDVVCFQAALRFLYSDEFVHIEDLLRTNDGARSASSTAKQDSRASLLQGVLAVGHKYQIARLQLWCEVQLCRCICVEEVCSVLRQAHLYEAKLLEQLCLQFVKDNMAAVVAQPAFASLTRDWPEILFKINMFLAGLSDVAAASLLTSQASLLRGESAAGTKRKRAAVE
eukprot:TRINITY_DN73910_c0_g1_i1.p1 TRINITY_DN73910_c0_g1~~TRINITY_DN73910_c0_g1_i1.p1  ORF type:complete len:519 (+),score=112.57 TRINITY_DN73910_c0_g1_i1:99-1655(+)